MAMQLPAGLADLSVVPRLLRPDDKHDEVVGQAGRVHDMSRQSTSMVYMYPLQGGFT